MSATPALLAETAGLEPAGAVVMALSLGLVLALNVYCMRRILRAPPTGGADPRGPDGDDGTPGSAAAPKCA